MKTDGMVQNDKSWYDDTSLLHRLRKAVQNPPFGRARSRFMLRRFLRGAEQTNAILTTFTVTIEVLRDNMEVNCRYCHVGEDPGSGPFL